MGQVVLHSKRNNQWAQGWQVLSMWRKFCPFQNLLGGQNCTKLHKLRISSRKLENISKLFLVPYSSPFMNLVNLRYSDKIIILYRIIISSIDF